MLAIFSVFRSVPFFFWLQECRSDRIRPQIEKAARNALLDRTSAPALAGLAAFLGKKFHAKIVRAIGLSGRLLVPRDLEYPRAGPRSRFDESLARARRPTGPGRRTSEEEFRRQIEHELDSIAAKAAQENCEPKLRERETAKSIDCYLYSRDDKYS